MGVTIPVGFGQYTQPITLIGDTEEMVFTFGFTDDTAASANDIATTINNVIFAQPTFAASTVSNQYTLQPGRVTVNRALGTFEGVSSTAARVGTATITCLPQNNAALITKRTARGGRRGRGRMYMPLFFVAEGNVTPVGGILASVVASTTLDWQTVRAQLIPLNLTMVLLHQSPPVGPPVPPDVITSLTCESVIATQRNRLRR